MRRANQITRKSERSAGIRFQELTERAIFEKDGSSPSLLARPQRRERLADCLEEPAYLFSTYIRQPRHGRSHYSYISEPAFRSFSSAFVVSALNIEAYWLYSCKFLRRNHMESATTITAASSIVPRSIQKLTVCIEGLSFATTTFLLDLEITNPRKMLLSA